MQVIIQHHVDLLKESWVGNFGKKIDISSSLEPNKSLNTGKFSLAQASVKWKFVIDAPDMFGLFLSPSRFCFHMCQ